MMIIDLWKYNIFCNMMIIDLWKYNIFRNMMIIDLWKYNIFRIMMIIDLWKNIYIPQYDDYWSVKKYIYSANDLGFISVLFNSI